MNMQVAVILPAAGIGSRFFEAPDAPKAASKIELDLSGRPVFLRSVEAFTGRKDVSQIILAVQPDAIEAFRFRWQDRLGLHGLTLVEGGTKDRWETVQRALEAIEDGCTHVAIHDAARPLISKTLIDRVFAAAELHQAVIPATPCSATLKRVEPAEVAQVDPLDAILGSAGRADVQRITSTVDRTNLVEAQTPQVFALDLLRKAYAQVDPAGVTDDASLVEALGEPVFAVEGDPTNLKITRPGDLELAAALVKQRDARSAKSSAAKRLFKDEDD